MALLPFSTVRWAGALALGAGVLGALPGPAQAAPDGRQISTQGANGAPASAPERLKGDGRYSFMENSCVRRNDDCLELDAKDTLQFPEESSFVRN